MRNKTPLIFGGGVDRKSGVPAVEATSFSDLRNAHLSAGRMVLRRGLKGSWDFGDDVSVLVEHPLAAIGVGAVVTYNHTTRIVRLYIMLNDGTVASVVGTVWTLPVGSDVPSVIVADSYTVLAIAHDEAVYGNRQVTRYYDVQTGIISDLMGDLNGDGTPAPIKFRGVAKHLNYLFGWGYGSETPNDSDRGEIVRVSLPAQPTVFDKEHYFLAGQRGDPVVKCSPVGEDLAVRKATESHRIFGYDRATFGIKPMDTEYGQIGGRLDVTLKGRNIFWSLEGPRMSGNGPSEDLALNLALSEEAVSLLAQVDTIDTRLAFAIYIPDVREIWFVFGQWAFVLHTEDDKWRWSYNEFSQTLVSGGVLYSVVGAGVGPTSEPYFIGAGDVGHTAPVDDFESDIVTVGFTAELIGTPLTGDETAELWLRSRFDGAGWYKAAELYPVIPGYNTFPDVTLDQLGVMFDVGVRYRVLGLYGAAYVGPPELWPSTARGSFTTNMFSLQIEQDVGTSFADPGFNGLHRKDATHLTLVFNPKTDTSFGASPTKPDPSQHPELRHRLSFTTAYDMAFPELSPWTQVFDDVYSNQVVEHVRTAAVPGSIYGYRYHVYTAWDNKTTYQSGLLYDFFDPGTIILSNACAGSAAHVQLGIQGDPGQFDVGDVVTSVDTVVERRVGAGAWSEIARITTSAAGRPTTYTDMAAPEGVSVDYRARWEVLAYAVTDIGPWRQAPNITTPSCP